MTAAQLKIAKRVVLIVWLLLAASFLLPPSGLGGVGRVLFGVLLLSHAIECALYWPALRATRRPLAGQLAQTILFGYFHYQSIKRGGAAR